MLPQTHIHDSTPMGANLAPGGATFRLWAPRARSVHLLGDFNDWELGPDSEMQPGPAGHWTGFVANLTDGAPYKFWIVGPGTEPESGFKRDPYARELSSDPPFPLAHCLLRDPHSFPWRVTNFRRPAFSDLILYQLHVGTFSIPTGKFNGKFFDVIDRLPHLAALGVNAIQTLPIVEFPTEFSLGYNGTDYFSPESDYTEENPAQLDAYITRTNALLAAKGLPPYARSDLLSGIAQLKAMIDVAHAYGIAILLDVVYNHAGGGFDDQSLWFLDRLPKGNHNDSLYFTDQGWAGGLVFAYWNQSVRQFLIDNAAFYLDEFRVDGFRFDEVSVMDHFGGWLTCQDLTSTLRARHPSAPLIAEYWPVNGAVVGPVPHGGAGFDATWHDALRESVRSALGQASAGSGAFVDLTRVAHTLQPEGLPDSWRAVTCLENHDIVKRDGPRVARLADGFDSRSWLGRSRSRVANGLLLTAPGIPLLFMGQEFLEDKSWSDDPNAPRIHWAGLDADDKPMTDFLRFMQDLVALRRRQPALRAAGLNVFHVHDGNRVLAFHRWIPWVGRDVIVAITLREQTWHGYRIGFPTPGRWLEVLNSDVYDPWLNPAPAGNHGAIDASSTPWHGLPASAEITIPANGIVVFARDPGD